MNTLICVHRRPWLVCLANDHLLLSSWFDLMPLRILKHHKLYFEIVTILFRGIEKVHCAVIITITHIFGIGFDPFLPDAMESTHIVS